MGMDIRYVVTSLNAGSAEHIYDTLYCARGNAENLNKMHKAQLKSDRTILAAANVGAPRDLLEVVTPGQPP